jgi:exosome complex component RRP45
LAHFQRPDVTTCGDGEFIIHKPEEKDLIPIVLHHYPICVTYALFDAGKIHVADPTVIEERVSKVSLVIAMNGYNEICSLHLTGVSLTSPYLISQCSELAAERAKVVISYLKESLQKDKLQREDPNFKGYSHLIELSKESVLNSIKFPSIDVSMNEDDDESDSSDDVESKPVHKVNENTVSTTSITEISSDSSSDSD